MQINLQASNDGDRSVKSANYRSHSPQSSHYSQYDLNERLPPGRRLLLGRRLEERRLSNRTNNSNRGSNYQRPPSGHEIIQEESKEAETIQEEEYEATT